MRDRSWLAPSLVLTAMLGLTALLLMPNTSGVLPALGLLPLWMFVSAALAAIYTFFAMLAAGIKDPLAYLVNRARTHWRELAMAAVGMTVAGLNMCAFMWSKPLLNHYVEFRADPALAALDRMLFLGIDPWRLFDWLNSGALAIFYHRGWFAMMIVTLLLVLTRPPSPQKSAVMLTYFLLWSVAGPVIHLAVPAAGPIFYQRLGYGDAFAGIAPVEEITQVADYLWQVYQGSRFGPASGISAMPSLHIATSAWMMIAVVVFARRWAPVMAALTALIFVLSISFGWHYASDGIVGGVAAVLLHRLCLWFYRDRAAALRTRGPQPIVPAEA